MPDLDWSYRKGEGSMKLRASYPFLVLVVAAVYFGSAKLGLSLGLVPQVTAVWPPTGIALVAILVLGNRIWPALALGAFLANITANEYWPTACGIALGNTLEAVVGAWLLRRVVQFNGTLGQLKDVLGLVVLAAGVSTTISATIGVTSLCLGGVQPWQNFASLWSLWWLGDALGDLVMAPVLLVWLAEPPPRWRRGELVEGGLLWTGLLILGLVVFLQPFPADTEHYPLPYTVFPIVIWAALRFGQRGTTSVTFIASAIAILGTVSGSGPFAKGSVHENLMLLQIFMGVVALTALVLAAVTTERKHLENELQQRVDQLADSDIRKDEFLAMLAHELRNPLAPIRNALHLLDRPGLDPGRLDQVRGVMERQVQQMVRLVDDLLDISRITRGKIQLRKEPVELAAVVARAVETARPLIDAHGHEFGVSLPSEPCFLDGDLTRLAQALANLLNNAAKFTEKGGHIWLTARRDGREAVIAVKDTGIGIAPEWLDHIFELFTQADRSLDRSQGGLGIGLTLVRWVIEMHGGSVQATSPGLGKGSEFIIRLPALAEHLSPHPSPKRRGELTPPSLLGKGSGGLGDSLRRRVLIVDDNKDSAETFAVLLKMWDYHVETAADGPAALAAAGAFRPELIFLDIGLPGMNGYEVAKRYRRQPELRDTVLVAMTGYGQDDARLEAEEAGFDHYLVKPVPPEILEEFLTSHGNNQRAQLK
jgi:signal transduction histidine kinase/ActR/RegA family two-component response regulator